MIDIIAHLTRQFVFSRATFGPGPRTEGVLQHIEKEIVEVRKELELFNSQDTGSPGYGGIALEQVDLVILSLDGLLRSISKMYPLLQANDIADLAWRMVVAKQSKNEMRNWPDWRQSDQNKPIEHERGVHD